MTRGTRRQLGAWILAGVLAISSAVPALAAEDREKIDKVTLNFSYDKEPASGDEIGDILVSTNSDQFSVDYVEYTNGGDTWTVGDVPEVRVELVAESGCYFGYESKSHFDLNGGGAEFKDADRQDDNTYMVLFVELDRRKAIEKAIKMARKGDLVLILGKGHEKTILRKEGAVAFEDIKVAREVLRER